ncbi:conserved hypothetical protein [Ricinus communis]|uniref:Secreted protein n=1 Tax=Ricinus communis TaxID=3988 RepID=B9SIC9_RICCO|nr:conserved hypothetical protein [Ricinus communis]
MWSTTSRLAWVVLLVPCVCFPRGSYCVEPFGPRGCSATSWRTLASLACFVCHAPGDSHGSRMPLLLFVVTWMLWAHDSLVVPLLQDRVISHYCNVARSKN